MTTKLILILATTLAMLACENDKPVQEFWRLELSNQTSSKIEISFKSIQYPEEDKTFIIDENDVEVLFQGGNAILSSFDPITREYFDSAYIFFDHQYKLIYYYDKNTGEMNLPERNILLKSNFESIEDRNNGAVFRYVINDQDLSDAMNFE